jgi:hypothetical protein
MLGLVYMLKSTLASSLITCRTTVNYSEQAGQWPVNWYYSDLGTLKRIINVKWHELY